LNLSLGVVLRNTWYPKYLPKNIKKFSIPGWKVKTINAGSAGKQLQLSRLSDGKTCEASYAELEAKMTTQHSYISTMMHFGFDLIGSDDNQLTFELRGS